MITNILIGLAILVVVVVVVVVVPFALSNPAERKPRLPYCAKWLWTVIELEAARTTASTEKMPSATVS